jgi:lysophospholipase L1-like esterase
MLDKSGQPNEKLFVEDQLHMNEKGYKIWKKRVKAFL